MKKHKLCIFLILSILLLFHGLNNYYILTKSRYCLGPDSTSYFSRTVQTFQILKKFKLNMKSVYETYERIFRDDFKPPLFFLTAVPFLLFGIDKNNIIMSNLIYFAILLFATYGIGKRLYNFKVGILSAFLVSMFPTVFALSRTLMLDFALMAMVALTFYLFVLNEFDSFKFSLITGIVIGLGILTKQGYFIFLLPMLFYLFLQKNNLKNKKIIRNVIFSIMIGLLISIIFYYAHSGRVYYSTSLWFLYNKKELVPFSYRPYFYLRSILTRQLLPFFSSLFLTSLLFYLLKKKYFLPIMIFILLLFFSNFFFSKADRHILPIFPYIAIMISGFIWSLEKFRRFLIISLVVFSFLQYFIICYASPLPMSYGPLQKILSGLHQKALDDYGLFFRIDGNWQGPSEEIIDIIDDVKKNKIDRKIKILFIGQERRIDNAIDYLRVIKELNIELSHLEPDPTFLFYSNRDRFVSSQMITQFDFIIIEQNPRGKIWIHTASLYNAFKQNSDKFNFIKSVSFPDDSLCYVYKKK